MGPRALIEGGARILERSTHAAGSKLSQRHRLPVPVAVGRVAMQPLDAGERMRMRQAQSPMNATGVCWEHLARLRKPLVAEVEHFDATSWAARTIGDKEHSAGLIAKNKTKQKRPAAADKTTPAAGSEGRSHGDVGPGASDVELLRRAPSQPAAASGCARLSAGTVCSGGASTPSRGRRRKAQTRPRAVATVRLMPWFREG